ncbi:hypothetical protein EDB81DRAFT_876720 [Dactylonectria macrodidyma]|uniref:Uncharacterized protein n=1 Tax=Dactylonectria macrodidyma TaxID=307937 RepID=A0A9P9FQG2_9HYPO|nr:hypothetical protein EDB81DRAFT_876720 [Dactylonectria macrodidyma]
MALPPLTIPQLGYVLFFLGEQTATALEANLSNLESKLDAILAALEANVAEQPKTSEPEKAKSQTVADKGPVEDDIEPGKTA